MRILIFIFLTGVFYLNTVGQSPSLSFLEANVYGDGEGKNHELNAMCSDTNGNLYVFGRFAGAVDFDPSAAMEIYSSGSSTRNLYLAKYDSAHQLIWFNHLIGSSNNYANDIALDNNGNIVICGSFVRDVDFDPTATSYILNSTTYNNSDGFVAKYAANGQLIWASQFGGNSVDGMEALCIDNQNNIYVTGGFSDTVNFTGSFSLSSLISTGFQDPYLAKYDAYGNFDWAFSIPGSGLPGYGMAMELAHDGNIILGGVFNNTVDFNPALATAFLTTNGNLDVFIAKYTTTGSYLWAKNFGGISEDKLYELAVSNSGNIYATGYFQSTADFNPSSATNSISSNGNKDIFVAKYDALGNYKWAHGFGNSSTDQAEGMDLDANENVYIGGYFVNQVDFDPSGATANATSTGGDAFLASYDSLGNYRWVSQTSGSGFEKMEAVHISGQDHAYGGGYFTGTVDLDPGIGSTLVSSFGNSYSGFLAAYTTQNGSFLSGFAYEDREGENDEGKKIAHDAQGNIYTCGYFQGGVDFDPSTAQNYLDAGGNMAAYICKYDINNNLLWAKMIKGSSNVLGDDLTIDQQGNVIVTGWMMGTVDLNPGSGVQSETSSGSSDVFVVKLNSNGQFIWGKRMGGPSNDEGWAIASDKNNDLYITGYFRSTADFDPGSGTANLTATNRDVFLVKLSSSGNYQWAFKTGGVSNDYGTSVCTDTSNNVIIGGYFRSNSDFDPSSGTYNLSSYVSGLYDAYIAKYSSAGTFIWAKNYGGYQSDFIYDLELDDQGDIVAIGAFKDTVDMDPGAGIIKIFSENSSRYDNFVLKVDKNGNSLWAKAFGGGYGSYPDEYPYDLDISDGNLFITGYFRDTTDLDPGAGVVLGLGNGGQDVYINVLDSAGNYLNSATFGGITTDIGQSISVFGTSVFTTGYFQAYADFDPGVSTFRLNGFGDKDIFIQKLGSAIPCSSVLDTISPVACGSYISPSGKLIQQSGVYYDTIPFGNGCDSVFRIELSVNPTSRDTLYVHGCYSYYDSIAQQLLTAEGFYTRTLSNAFNCDSIIVLHVSLDTSSYDTTAIACDSMLWRGNYYSSSGTYYDTLQNHLGCDSLLLLNLTILQKSTSTISPSVCESYTSPSGNHTWTSSGIYYDTLTNAAGCDSIITINLDIRQNTQSVISPSVCYSYLSPSGNHTWYSSGTYLDTIANAAGCDSIVTVNLTIHSTTTANLYPVVCDSFTSPSGNHVWYNSGTYIDTIPNSHGCDSIMTINLIVGNTNLINLYPVVCEPYTSPSGNYIWSSSGTYMDTIAGSGTCDSIFIVNLTVNQPSSSSINPVACNSYTSPSGHIWTSTGNYMDTIPNSTGCDSIISINLTVNQSSQSSITAQACGSYVSPSGMHTWFTSGNYVDTISNTQGCDSIISINLTINQDVQSTITPTACGTYTSPSGKIWFNSGSYTDTIPTVHGCDSVISIQLTINQSSQSSIAPTACKSFLSPSGKYLWTSSGTYLDTVPNYLNCDSLIMVQLTIIQLDTSVSRNQQTLTANGLAAGYQWIDCQTMTPIAGANQASFTALQNGTYAVVLTQSPCSDTSNCHTIANIGMNDTEWHKQIRVYPNPTKDELFVELPQGLRVQIYEVVDSYGKTLQQGSFGNTNNHRISLWGAPGLYVIKLHFADGRIQYYKVVKL
jgi:hypothetical protein